MGSMSFKTRRPLAPSASRRSPALRHRPRRLRSARLAQEAEGARGLRVLKDMLPIAVSLALMAAVTAVLWHLQLTTGGSDKLVYIYLFPVALIAALYSGRLAVLCSAIALVCADY